MKRPSRMINGRSSSSKALHAVAGHLSEQAQKVKFASLHEEEEDEDEAAAQIISSTSKNVVNNHKKFVCNKCGKAFQSSKAICGHMASHSQKEKPSSNVGAKQKLMMEMESDSDTESGAGPMRRRSRRTRYKKHDSVAAGSKTKRDVVNNCSSEASGVEQEQEEVAISLMMLSRDSSNWGGLNSICDSSENNPGVLEDRSISTKFGKHSGLSSWYEIKENYRRKGVETLGNFYFGSIRNEVKNVETDVKVRTSTKLEEEPHLSLKKLKSLMDGEGYSQMQRPKVELYPRRGVFNESNSAGMCKRGEHETPVLSQFIQPFHASVACNKHFTAASPYESDLNSFETNAYHNIGIGKGIIDDNSGNVGNDRKKSKHASLVCYKDIGSGNALGYCDNMHSEEVWSDEVTAISMRQGTHSHASIDLNLPAPMEDEEANESMGSY